MLPGSSFILERCNYLKGESFQKFCFNRLDPKFCACTGCEGRQQTLLRKGAHRQERIWEHPKKRLCTSTAVFLGFAEFFVDRTVWVGNIRHSKLCTCSTMCFFKPQRSCCAVPVIDRHQPVRDKWEFSRFKMNCWAKADEFSNTLQLEDVLLKSSWCLWNPSCLKPCWLNSWAS